MSSQRHDARLTLSVEALTARSPACTLVLTVNNRLARQLTLELAARLRTDHRPVTELPRIVPLTAWLSAAADELAFTAEHSLAAHSLDTFATELAWSEVICQEEAERPLLNGSQAAKLAMDADVLMEEWALHIPAGAETDEFRQFAHWRACYRRRLRALDAEDFNHRYSRVLHALRRGDISCPHDLVLAGFTDISPRFTRLLDAFAERGASVGWLQGKHSAARAQQYVAADQGAEWRAAAAWAAQRLAQNPAGRYAIVSTRLEEEVVFARRVLGETLASQDGGAGLAFNVTVGRPLSEWPAVRAGLAWLSALAEFVTTGVTDSATLGMALRSGHCVGEVRDGHHYAMIDARWRQQAWVRIDPQRWASELAHCPLLRQAWVQASEIWLAAGPKTACDMWAPIMKAALAALGFPGERTLESDAYQVVTALGALLDRYAALAPIVGPMDGLGAVRLLARAARATLFQPRSDPQSRLDVLGLLEAEAGRWDGIWILGLTDKVLPAAATPNPLLPLAVLKKAGAPRATPERERQWAEAIFSTLSRCAPEVMLSYARTDGERELRPSPLIVGFPLSQWSPPGLQALPRLPHECLVDEQGPPLREGDPGATGGADVLETQARNPMWAFVRHRLGGRAMRTYAQASPVNMRGQFLHRALEMVWGLLRNQQRLQEAITQDKLPTLIAQAASQAAAELLTDYPLVLTRLELARAQEVLAAWLMLEAQRTPFVVQEIESEHIWRRNGLALKLRLDRVDCLPEGSLVITDYKTGMALPNVESDWARARPINLQLPCYASALAQQSPDTAVAGLMLAHVHARQAAARGLAEVDLGLKAVTLARESRLFQEQEWSVILYRWREAIASLADEYVAGHAANVSHSLKDLQYCEAMPFLRLDLEEDDG